MISVSISGRKATKTGTELITSGSVGKKIHFDFDAEWNNISRLACFTGSSSRDQLLDANNEAAIPWECLQTPGKPLIVGIYGTNSAGSVVIPTIYCNLGMIHKGATPCNQTAQQATPTAVQQMMTAVTTCTNKATSAASSATSAEDAAATARASAVAAENAATSARQSAGAAVGTATMASTNATNALNKANTVYNAYQAGELSGVYIGSVEPTDGANVWIDTNGPAEGNWELIEQFTLTSATSWTRQTTPSGTAFNFCKVLVHRKYPSGCDLTGTAGYGRIRMYNASGSYLTTESAKPTDNSKEYCNISRFVSEHNMAMLDYTRTTAASNGAVPWNIKGAIGAGFSINFGNCTKIASPSDDKDPVGTVITIYAVRA